MGFNSFTFILVFLPVLMIGWHALNRLQKYTVADVVLIIMSLYFYYTFGVNFLIILSVSIGVNYALSAVLKKIDSRNTTDSNIHKKLIKIIGVLFNLGLLFYFKYLGFFADNLNVVFKTGLTVDKIIMPIGISFFTFGQISYIVDRANGEAPHYSFVEYTLYTAYFPKLIQGPIAFHKEMIDQFRDKSLRTYDSVKFSAGIISFVLGLSKKVILADVLSKIVNYGFEQTYYLDTLTVIAVMLAYTFQIYFDFSGYCDMANGISLMLGYRLPTNFNSPYKAASAKELWQRWHMTLSRFFIKYVYIPLGGSRKGRYRTIANVLIVFILSGLWHGAGWTYVCWGLMQGLLVVWDDLGIVSTEKEGKFLFRKEPLLVIPKALGRAMTFIAFVASLIFFRSESVEKALAMFRRLFFFTWPGFLTRTAANLDIAENYVFRQFLSQMGGIDENVIYMITMVIYLAVSGFIITRKNTEEIIETTTFDKKTLQRFTQHYMYFRRGP